LAGTCTAAASFVLQRTAAEQVLKTFQENPDAWTRVDTILEKGKTQQTKFFALQVITVAWFTYSSTLCCWAGRTGHVEDAQAHQRVH
jgi:hypothetical protein